jgi:hypothetical protein
MTQKEPSSRKIHFHIRWAPPLRWDSERFDTQEAALAHANDTKGPGESFRIVEADEACARCKGSAGGSRIVASEVSRNRCRKSCNPTKT